MVNALPKDNNFNPLPNDKFLTLPNGKSFAMTISNLTKMDKNYPNR